MSIPFICIAVVKGVGTFVHLASQLTGTSMQGPTALKNKDGITFAELYSDKKEKR